MWCSPEDTGQHTYDLRDAFNAPHSRVRTGAHWPMSPQDFPRGEAVAQQPNRWFRAGVSGAIVHDLHLLWRTLAGRDARPAAVILDARTLPSLPESGGRAGYDGGKRRTGSKVHAAGPADTLLNDLAAGKSYRAVARTFGVSRQMVLRIAHSEEGRMAR